MSLLNSSLGIAREMQRNERRRAARIAKARTRNLVATSQNSHRRKSWQGCEKSFESKCKRRYHGGGRLTRNTRAYIQCVGCVFQVEKMYADFDQEPKKET